MKVRARFIWRMWRRLYQGEDTPHQTIGHLPIHFLFFVDTLHDVAIMLAGPIHQAGSSTAMANWLPEQDWIAISGIVLKNPKLRSEKKRFVNFIGMPEENYPDYFSTLTNRRNYGGKRNNR